jgi:serine protease
VLPGYDFVSAAAPGDAGYVGASGSSFAAPAVAAAASLMWALNPAQSAAQVEDGLKRSARPHVLVPQLGDCAGGSKTNRCACTTTCGAGMRDAVEALAYAAAPTDTPPSPAPTPAPSAGSSGGGGGALSLSWLAALALASAGLRRARQR